MRIHMAAPLIALALAAATAAFAQLIESAGAGDLRPEMEKARRHLASN